MGNCGSLLKYSSHRQRKLLTPLKSSLLHATPVSPTTSWALRVIENAVLAVSVAFHEWLFTGSPELNIATCVTGVVLSGKESWTVLTAAGWPFTQTPKLPGEELRGPTSIAPVAMLNRNRSPVAEAIAQNDVPLGSSANANQVFSPATT